MTEPALTVSGVSKRFGAREVLRGVSLTLECGRVTAALGRSGAGKSTLLRAIAGLERIDSGEIRNAARVLSGSGVHLPPERRRVGLVFQDYALFPHLTVLQNVMFGLKHNKAGQLEKAAARAHAMGLLESMHLADRAGAHPHMLSGGEQQRVALARALAPAPDLVLMDEPFSGLDAALRESTREETLDAVKQAGAAVLIVTHDAREAMLMADALVLMADGRVIQQGAPDALYRAPGSLAAARLLGDVNEWSGRVEGGALRTPFGALPAPGVADGAEATVLARPECLTLSPAPGAAFIVTERRAAGAEAHLRVRAEDGVEWRVRAHAATAPHAGDAVTVTLDPALAPVIAAASD